MAFPPKPLDPTKGHGKNHHLSRLIGQHSLGLLGQHEIPKTRHNSLSH